MSQTQNIPTFSTPKISTKSGSVHAVPRHIAPLRDRRSPVAATTPKKIKFQNQTSVILVASKQPPPYATNSAAPLPGVAPRLRGRTAPATTASPISRRRRRNSGIRRHQLGAAVLGYHSPGNNPPAGSIGGRIPQSSPLARLQRAPPTPGIPNHLELARRSSAILHIAGDLQKLHPAWGEEEPRNPPASA